MIVEQTSTFARAMKKLRPNQREQVENAIHAIMKNPLLGESKKGDLAGMRVYKFPMLKQLTLIAYSYCEQRVILRLLALGSHENFYRNMKKIH